MFTKRPYNSLFLLLIVLENLFLFVFHQQGITGQAVNSSCYFAVSLLFGILLLVKFYNVPDIIPAPVKKYKGKFLLFLLYVCCFILANSFTIRVMKTYHYRAMSDIIPTIEVLCSRLLSGRDPYAPTAMEVLGFHGSSNYLPMHWLPYTFAEYFRFDYRSVTFSIWFIGACVIMLRSYRSGRILDQVLAPVLLTSCYLLLAYVPNVSILCCTVETMVAGYYMILMAGLNQKNVVFTGIIIGICLLSRYYIAIWLPLWAFALFISGRKKQLFRIMGVVLATVSVLYIIPFLSRDWTAIFNSFKAYQTYPMVEWNHIDDATGKPFHLYAGVGFAYLFYENYMHTNLVAGFALMRNVLYIASFCILCMMGIWYWFNYKKIDNKIFLLASFKIFLTVFLAFIMSPYVYLMITANFVSIAIYVQQARYIRAGEAAAASS